MSTLHQDRATKGVQLAPDAIVCPVCGVAFNCITTQHCRKHGYTDALAFKADFSLPFLKAPSIRAKQAAFMAENSPTKGNQRTEEERDRMGAARRGKGKGVAGKYERTPEIRSRISLGVTEYSARQPQGYANKHFKNGWVLSEKADQEVWVRSSWERRVLWVLDQYAEVEEVKVEPFAIPYLLDGVQRHYTPDLLVTFEGDVQEVWEIKPLCHTATPKNLAKFEAMRAYTDSLGMGFRIVTLAAIEGMERKTRMSQALACALEVPYGH